MQFIFGLMHDNGLKNTCIIRHNENARGFYKKNASHFGGEAYLMFSQRNNPYCDLLQIRTTKIQKKYKQQFLCKTISYFYTNKIKCYHEKNSWTGSGH